jgi:hypothetical protein
MTERRFEDESADFQRGYREGWNDREDDLIAGVNRVSPTVTDAPVSCDGRQGDDPLIVPEGLDSALANSAGEGLRPFAGHAQKKSEGGAS